ncbi:MAG: hypothetical protein AB1813_22210 [Verrucomicrobiota bacterium]
MSAGLVEKPSEGSALIVAHLESVAGKKRTAELLQAAIDRKLHDLDRKEMFRGRPFGENHFHTQTRNRLRGGWNALTTGEQNSVARSALNLFLESPPAPQTTPPQTPAPAAASATPQTPAPRATISTPTAAFAPAKAAPAKPAAIDEGALQCLHAAIFDGNGRATRETIEADFCREGLSEIVGLDAKLGLRAPQLWGKGAATAREIAKDFTAVLRGQAPSTQFSSGACLARRYIESKNKYPNKI